jgi:hypothetical protein
MLKTLTKLMGNNEKRKKDFHVSTQHLDKFVHLVALERD